KQGLDIGGGGMEYHQPLGETDQLRCSQSALGHPGRIDQCGGGSRGMSVVYCHSALRLPNLPFFAKLWRLMGDRMHTIANRGGPQDAHPGTGPASPDWESVRTFLELVRSGSFRSAAERLGLSPNVRRPKIADLERTLGPIPVTRHVDGIRTTAAGAEILLA